ncbi:hypothetical protein TIN4_35 [Tsukamurella phage TIN4]|uniref:Uncharacterized protein n=2 Tax=Tinduovirus TIN3 TaxID=1982571 RepID=A0A0K0N5R3_9CAUD|nr:hypothetical protein AVT54_gp090 [Tsukamurella phage TIN3]YP_009604165.1 hypothetical protein FDH87_gp090 [Tsukamurella phage TIN4]AKJ71832.1 hypothetical protein TIN3_35 [Tsukamurella phage TIN3]AKJ71941.1 hypothetical protein TIN4_35 [Tsukamurella phage TIN4]
MMSVLELGPVPSKCADCSPPIAGVTMVPQFREGTFWRCDKCDSVFVARSYQWWSYAEMDAKDQRRAKKLLKRSK